MRNLTPEILALVTGGSAGVLPECTIESITTDSRNVGPGALFAAIKGERVDGHDFLSSAQEKGAVCALVEREVADCSLPQILVPSTEAALRQIAAFYRCQFSIPFVGVTGSVGKTTAKEMISAVLSQRWNTLKTDKNFNNELGVPITLFRLREEHEAAVVEMGISGFGEMTRLTEIVKPDLAVFTLIGDSHLEFLHDREGVLKAKSEIVQGMKPEALVICNGDDALLSGADFGRPTLFFGLGENCDVRAVNIENTEDLFTRCEILYGERRIPVTIPSYGQHMVYAALIGAAVGLHYGLTDEEIAQGIASFENVGHRNRVIKTAALTIIDDCYNSNPSSARSAVASMKNLPGRHVCILGDMLELGPEAASLHRELGVFCAQEGVLVIACGELSKKIADGAGEGSCWFADTASLIEKLPELIRRGDAVLVKASRRMKFEDITEALSAIC